MILPTFLRIIAPVFVLVGLMHLVLGPGAEVLLGAEVGEQLLGDPVIDSQNRFYGVIFTLYGFLMYVCASDLKKYRTILLLVVWVFFAAGLARLVSIAVVGIPSTLVLLLLLTELLLPPLLHLWLHVYLTARDPQSAN